MEAEEKILMRKGDSVTGQDREATVSLGMNAERSSNMIINH